MTPQLTTKHNDHKEMPFKGLSGNTMHGNSNLNHEDLAHTHTHIHTQRHTRTHTHTSAHTHTHTHVDAPHSSHVYT